MKYCTPLLINLFFFTSLAAQECDQKNLAALQNEVTDVKQALGLLNNCFDALDASAYTHMNANNVSYCSVDQNSSTGLQLAHLESRLAAVESGAGTYCCTDEECKSRCPSTSAPNTCDPDCKPHAPAFITSLDEKPRIQNIANRLLSVTPIINLSPTTACTPTSATKTEKTKTPPLEVTGLNGSS